MKALIVESRTELGMLWQRHLRRKGIDSFLVTSQDQATGFLGREAVDVIILDLVLLDGSALAVSDYASYRQPDASVIFVTSSSFFSDGSIFAYCANARAFLPASTSPEDLTAMVEHYGSVMQST